MIQVLGWRRQEWTHCYIKRISYARHRNLATLELFSSIVCKWAEPVGWCAIVPNNVLETELGVHASYEIVYLLRPTVIEPTATGRRYPILGTEIQLPQNPKFGYFRISFIICKWAKPAGWCAVISNNVLETGPGTYASYEIVYLSRHIVIEPTATGRGYPILGTEIRQPQNVFVYHMQLSWTSRSMCSHFA